ncbi:hypothetical protein Dalk_5246 [Desulfatibacillum aliphaticivorans]|uniref:Helix-turn-helix domain-containing protein n=1 Tax=Desulfatibacillum aliphaticivorans TaxID=218208 RepID=B8FED5_DESAL|nr:hypothetical protein Dalk_2795 [Desulfatibacillum aliphaticivorans]ACL06916.1 hypothetical protein Dalk_5246 [Desulfatibacillum aliphaticivorans]
MSVSDSKALESLEAKQKAGVRLVSVDEAAIFLGISPQTLRNRLSRSSRCKHPIPSKKLGGRRVFDLRQLHDFVDALPG